MSRERLLILYSLAFGSIGWIWLLLTPPTATPLAALALFGALALAVDLLSFRTPPADTHSLSGIVLITAALALGPAAGALLAAIEGALSGVLLTFLYHRPPGPYLLGARPFLRGGARAMAILAGAALASAASGRPQYDPQTLDPLALALAIVPCYLLSLQLGRIGREYLQGGRSGVSTWWRSSWRLALGAEFAPLPLAVLGAAIYTRLGGGYFLLAGLALVAAAAAVRRAALNVASQRRSVRELALLNEISRAIIRSELDVEALCDLVYREASKVVDTASFHLGLFDDDRYTLVVRVQDRVRLPPLTVTLAPGDGLIGWIRQTGKAVLVEDFTREMDLLPARPRYQSDRPPRSGIYVPLIAGDTVIGSISVQSYAPRAFNANDLRLLSLIADQAAAAIESANAYRAQQEEAWTLNALLQVAANLSLCERVDDLLATAARLAPLLIGAPRCHVLLWNESEQVFRVGATYGLGRERAGRFSARPIAPGDAPLLAALRAAATVADGPRLISLPDAGRRASLWPELIGLAGSGSLVVMPLAARTGLLGALVLDHDAADPGLDERRRNLCAGAAGQLAAAPESLLLAREAEQAALLEQELKVARDIQHALLAARAPALPGWQVAAGYRSARLVGGDFYDFWALPRDRCAGAEENETVTGREEAGRPAHGGAATATVTRPAPPALLGFVIADVSDKGVPAAMFMALARSLVRAAALDGSPPALALERANRWITRDAEAGMFVTIFYGILDPANGHLRYSSAGHNPPLLYRAAEEAFVELRAPGIALGVLEPITLAEAELWLAPGDVLVCYTDGVTEAVDERLEAFGPERLRALIAARHGEPATAIVEAISAAVDQHGHGQPPFDDVTLVVVKRLAPDP
ncbi:MAG: SpoIIE family protein phosphatase [Chloroflexaceae bacterium]|nr:SpoIIE family protein phosphatase [Chloroflexaceae bacterium]